MPTRTELLLNAYYLATLPLRWRVAAVRAARGVEPICILFYHRVADMHPNDWTMSTRRFAKQIDWLRRHFDVVSLCEAQTRIASGQNYRPTACITFDDGYAENMKFAVPLLLQHKIPFTYFVSTAYVLNAQPFPHDVQLGVPLLPNTPEDLWYMAAEGAEIGAHTRSHRNLGLQLTTSQLVGEVLGGKHDLERLIDREVRYFAFPYGHPENMTQEAFRVAYQSGYAGVCSAYGGYNAPGDDPFHFRRFHADPEMVRFKNWLTIDPRKVRSQMHFDSGDYRARLISPTTDPDWLEMAANA